MSHTMNIDVEIHDRTALFAACQRLNLRVEEGIHRLRSSREAGLAVYLRGWLYPVIFREDGSLAYDNYHGRWGSMEELNRLRAHYGLEKAKAEARLKGYAAYEGFNAETGELELRIQVGGG